MSNEIVEYENRLNTVPLRRFNSREMNLFFSIASRVREHGTDEIELTFDQLKDMSKYTQHGEQFVQDLNQTYHKLLSLNAMTDDGHTITAFVLFTQYEIDRDNEVVRISVNPKFKGMFNELKHWTRFSLEQFANLKSTYSKSMFRLLKQWRTIGRREFTIEEFRTLLDVPASFAISDIDKRVLRYIKEELVVPFPGLAVKKKYKGRGHKVIGYKFTWKPEANDANDFSKGELVERAKALDNIHHNASLTTDEKEAAVRRVVGLFDELPQWLREEKRLANAPKKLAGAELENLKAVNAKIALTITRVTQLIADGQKLTAGDKKKLAQLNELYASNNQRIATAEA